ncbi:hypothetical protein EDI_201550 [Entamoeba dispar SAW760]|uniref:Uncharacterized protein n=1 Tax=Entamoeba dispar (strain ATCC PRA-260 / SAW760) TaxID=370354 RepID=B0ETW3_ENTDS|nr:uncharacterized protein EDI_201550 [Entamoeba dispar SAW760]EDR22039.1 hypothetical protein EDI_201550 [Entamoeba dispar SAW760]|eukprot:EDR22039.1 hypothetical protein EDI_201550 [Entamoeba dispar SAW760]
MTLEQNLIPLTWDDVINDWNIDDNHIYFNFDEQYNYLTYFPLYVKFATTSVQHRHTLFQIFDSLKYLCKTDKEFNLLFWKYLMKTKPLPSREVVPITLPQPDSEKCFFNLELKFQQNKIMIEFHSELALFRDREIPSNTTNRHNSIQSLFNDKISALVLPLARYDHNSIQQQIATVAKYDVLFGSYNHQLLEINKKHSIMEYGDFFITMHSNLFYNMILHCKFQQPFILENPSKNQRFYSNLIFYLHRCKTNDLYFCMHELDTSELPKRIISVFSAVRQAILYDGYTSLRKIVFICPDTDLNLLQLKTNFDESFLN